MKKMVLTAVAVFGFAVAGVAADKNTVSTKINVNAAKLSNYLGLSASQYSDVEAISEYFDRVQVVREEDPMTAEQIESYKKYMPEQLWKDDLTWPEALAYTKNAVAPLKIRSLEVVSQVRIYILMIRALGQLATLSVEAVTAEVVMS